MKYKIRSSLLAADGISEKFTELEVSRGLIADRAPVEDCMEWW